MFSREINTMITSHVTCGSHGVLRWDIETGAHETILVAPPGQTLTNLHVVRDEESSTGWKLTVGPFPGSETVPTW